MFADCLHCYAASSEQPIDALDLPCLQKLAEDTASDIDVTLKNLVGDGAADLAERWAENGKLMQKLEIVRASLGPTENIILDRFLGNQAIPPHEFETTGNAPLSRDVKGKGKEQPAMRYTDSEDESDDGFSEDERGKTAHRLFASLAGIEENEHAWWVSSPASQKSASWVLDELDVVKSRSANSPAIPAGTTTGACWAKQLTPVSSPSRPLRRKQRSPVQMALTPNKRRHTSGSTSSSCTLPHLRKRLFAGERTLTSPVHLTSPRARFHGNPDASIVTYPSKSIVTPVASSSQLHTSAQLQWDHPPSPLLEVNNYPAKRTIQPAPTSCNNGTPKTFKQKASNFGHPVSHSPSRDENRASGEVSRPARIVLESRRRLSPHQRPLVSIPTSPNGLSSEVREENPRASDRRARRLKLHAQRLSIAERLARARPDLVVSTYESKREALLVREAKVQERARARDMDKQKEKMKVHLEATGTLLSIGTVDDDDGGMDWDRSRVLAEAIKADIANGRRPMLPPLICAETQ
jgi:DNA cross-link repair 1C protein